MLAKERVVASLTQLKAGHEARVSATVITKLLLFSVWQYVTECFASSSLFHKALKEAFESFCNRNVAGSSSSELMANFCDNLLKKV